jgi:hypothetical protein
MSSVNQQIVALLRRKARGQGLIVGVFHRGASGLVQAVADDGHRVLIVSDRFGPLLSAYQRVGGGTRPNLLFVEARWQAFPLRQRSLDALVLSCGLPRGNSALDTLIELRQLIRPGGLLVWPHPLADGVSGWFGRLVAPLRWRTLSPFRREVLCARTMEAGFADVEQELPSRQLLPWAVTSGRAFAPPA